MRKSAESVVESLTEQQRAECVFPAKHKDRWGMRYTGGGYRPGLPLSELDSDQRKSVDVLIRTVLSREGIAKAREVAKQDGTDLERMVIAFFGDPRTSETFAWRLGEHHFTIVHVEQEGDRVTELGPILLGSNPYGPWDKIEKAYLNLWRATAGQVAVVEGSGVASRPLKKGVGTDTRELTSGAGLQIEAILREISNLFTPDVSKMIADVFNRESISEEGLKLAYFSEVPKEIGKEGGRWDAKFGNSRFLMDLELSRGHNHMSLWLRKASSSE